MMRAAVTLMLKPLLSAALILAAAPGLAEGGDTGLTELGTGDAGRGWEAVGRLDLGYGSFCTGALIAPDKVLTAAHCLFERDTGARVPLNQIEFRAGWRNGRAEAYRGVRRAILHPDYTFLDDDRMDRVAVDIAVIQLDRPIRTPRIQPFETRMRLRRGDEVGVVSYAQGREEAPSLQEVCRVLERQSGVVMLSCSVDFGASGAPIFAFGEEGPVIVSVVSAKAMSEGKPVALASELRRAYAELEAAVETVPTGALNRGSAFVSASGGGGAKILRP